MSALFGHKVVLRTESLEGGGITKEVIVEGDGPSPKAGDEVRAHYVGKLADGKDFDSSKSRGRAFVFKIGIGAVISGWDVGMATMKVGEKAVLTCKPEHAYGASGAGGVIPPNATLSFEVELLGIGPEERGSWCIVA
jgi:FKBP-type peptidyl-prolyl cis-trans isomerase